MTTCRLLPLIIATLLLCCQPDARAFERTSPTEPVLLNLSLGLGFEYETGDYGTDDTIETWRVPLVIEWAPHERVLFSLEIPYVHQDRTGETVLIGGTPTPTRQRRSGRMSGSSEMVQVGEPTDGVVESTDSEGGLGDLTVDAAFTLLRDEGKTPRLLALLYAKLPTADEEKGLGTGEFDWGGGLGAGKRFGAWSGYAELLYIQPGSSELYDPDPYWEWLASISFRLKESLRPGLAISGGSAPFDGADSPLEVKARLTGLAGEHASYSLYLARGLSDASPDWGMGIFGYLDF